MNAMTVWRWLPLLLAFWSPMFAASKFDSQLREQRKALQNLERELAEQRMQLKVMETEERGVLNTLSLLDQNLGQTREYVRQLDRTETTLASSAEDLRQQIDSISLDIARQQEAMRKRIRELYMQGHRSQVDQLWKLLREKESPDRSLYQVRRLLRDDQERVVKLQSSRLDREDRQAKLRARLADILDVRKRKQKEQAGLQSQIHRQEGTLDVLRRDKEMQQKALEEFEQNQRMLTAMIHALEVKRKKDEEEARKRKAKAAKAAKAKGKKVVREPEKIAVVGPKCMPLKGELISEFGMHEHAVLHTVTRNLGVEIRAVRGAPVKSAAGGKIVAVTKLGGRGKAVIIEHPGALYSVYGHLRGIDVQVGQEVRHCQVIGEAGDEESMNGPKLYFQVSRGVHTIDPIEWLGK